MTAVNDDSVARDEIGAPVSRPVKDLAAQYTVAAYLQFLRAMPVNGGPGGEAAKDAWAELEQALMGLSLAWPLPDPAGSVPA